MKKMEIQTKPQLFEIPTNVWETLDFDVVQDTYSDMFKAGLVHPPFFVFSVRMPLRGFLSALATYAMSKGETGIDLNGFFDSIDHLGYKFIVAHYEFRKVAFNYEFRSVIDLGEGIRSVDFCLLTKMPKEFEREMVDFIYKCLTILLATKNTGKNVVTNSLRSGSKKARDNSAKYSTTTYISIGKIVETMHGSSGQRGPVRAHLRRGHVRRQRFGEGRSEEKNVFIAPVFVNADQEWISERRKYKLVG